jgi:hypothetical protein
MRVLFVAKIATYAADIVAITEGPRGLTPRGLNKPNKWRWTPYWDQYGKRVIIFELLISRHFSWQKSLFKLLILV